MVAPDVSSDAAEYLTIDEVLDDILQPQERQAPAREQQPVMTLKQEQLANAPVQRDSSRPRIAVSITGGGARGAYEAGAMEAILQAFRRHGMYPDVICGTSVGALIGTGLLVDLLYPEAKPDPRLPYHSRQSLLWDKICRKNQGARQVAGSRADIIRVLSGEEPIATIPGIATNLPRLLWHSAEGLIEWDCLPPLPYLSDHVLENRYLRDLLLGLMGAAAGARAGQISDAVIAKWNSGAQHHQSLAGAVRPELLLATSNISVSRTQVFAIARPETLVALADAGLWTVDLACQGPPFDDREHFLDNLFQVEEDGDDHSLDRETLCKAALTSSAVPAVFPSMHWHLHSWDNRVHVRHVFVDGGILDNSPVDLAYLAGATHVISLELTPLKSRSALQKDDRRHNVVDIIYGSLIGSMDGNVRTSIENLARANHHPGEHGPVQIYRMAPLRPSRSYNQERSQKDRERRRTPDLLDFDGAWSDDHRLVMGLYDWFMQGYLDVIGSEAAAQDDLAHYYTRHARTPRYRCTGSASIAVPNRFWRATWQAYPGAPVKRLAASVAR